MWKGFTQELFDEIRGNEDINKQRNLISIHCLEDSSFDHFLQRDIYLDQMFLATRFALEYNFDYKTCESFLTILAQTLNDFRGQYGEIVQDNYKQLLQNRIAEMVK